MALALRAPGILGAEEDGAAPPWQPRGPARARGGEEVNLAESDGQLPQGAYAAALACLPGVGPAWLVEVLATYAPRRGWDLVRAGELRDRCVPDPAPALWRGPTWPPASTYPACGRSAGAITSMSPGRAPQGTRRPWSAAPRLPVSFSPPATSVHSRTAPW